MVASDLPITQASPTGYTHANRSEQVGTDVNGKPIIAQVVLAGAHRRTYLGVQSLVLSGSAQTLTVPAGATLADIYAEDTGSGTSIARYWHGATPTATVGKRLRDDQEIGSAAPASFSAILQTGTITLRIEYASNA